MTYKELEYLNLKEGDTVILEYIEEEKITNTIVSIVEINPETGNLCIKVVLDDKIEDPDDNTIGQYSNVLCITRAGWKVTNLTNNRSILITKRELVVD
jgi:hypothetical protein